MYRERIVQGEGREVEEERKKRREKIKEDDGSWDRDGHLDARRRCLQRLIL